MISDNIGRKEENSGWNLDVRSDFDGTIEQGNSGFLDYTSGENYKPVTIVKPVIKQGPPIVSKSFFIHKAPEEPVDSIQIVEKEHEVRPRKHYNIVFVKAPPSGGQAISNNNVHLFPQTEEKTIIYVLSGKQNHVKVNLGNLNIPAPKPPNKPDVIFVKYNGEEDAHRIITDIQSEL